MHRHRALLIAMFGAAACLYSADPAADPLRTGAIELGIGAGRAFGNVGGARVDLPGIITYHAQGTNGRAGKLHLGIGMWRRYQFVIEAGAQSGGRRFTELPGGFQIESSTTALVYSGGLHVRFPIGRTLVPYVAGGLASVGSRADTLVRFTSPVYQPGSVLEASTRVRLREGSLAPFTGLGVKIYPFRSRLGFHLEGRGYFPTGSSQVPFGGVWGGIQTWFK